ncbi:AMP-binding protein [Gammaproteobacteria bacterium]|nr:AMP-binding protein [Gammaproteobacteria bacterium]
MEKIWLKNYPKGVPHEINPDGQESLVQILNDSCSTYSDNPAFYNLGVTLTYKQFKEYSDNFAAYLQNVLKLKKGDRLAIMMPNVLQYPIIMFGSLLAGVIVVNVNPLYTTPELVHQLNDAECHTIVVISNFADVVEKALPDVSLKNVIVTDIGDLFSRPKAFLINFVLKYIKKQIPTLNMSNALNFRSVLQEGSKLTYKKVIIKKDDIAFLQYTGGTTGVSKGAILTHRNLVANVLQAEAWFSPEFSLGKEIIITALPLYHIFSLTANCLFISKLGGLNVLITNPRDIPRFISEIAKFKFTVITGVNTLFAALLNNSKFASLDFSSMKISLGGGMPVQHIVADKWIAVTKKPLLEAYGLTETSPCAAINPVDLKEYNGTVGYPVSSTDIRIFDDNHVELPLNTAGEIVIKGPQVMSGYWKNESETSKVFTKDGWLLTGDIGSINDQGFVSILERKKDMILVSGFNVYPSEIEDIITGMSGVKEAAVVGVVDNGSGEIVKAYVVRSNLELTSEDVLNFCKKSLTAYKVPKCVEFRDDLPKTNVGKILRRAL